MIYTQTNAILKYIRKIKKSMYKIFIFLQTKKYLFFYECGFRHSFFAKMELQTSSLLFLNFFTKQKVLCKRKGYDTPCKYKFVKFSDKIVPSKTIFPFIEIFERKAEQNVCRTAVSTN